MKKRDILFLTGLFFDICYGKCMLKGPYGPAYLDIDTADNFGYGFAIGFYMNQRIG